MNQRPSTGANCAGTWALIPVKRFELAKTRLGSLLCNVARKELAEAMLKDVLHSISDSRCFDGILVVTSDTRAMEIAASVGAESIRDERESGTNGAVLQGIASLQLREAKAIVIVPSDIPLIESEDLRLVTGLLQRCPVVIGADVRGRGTNLLAYRSMGEIEPSFGEDSFSRHLHHAFHVRLPITEVRLPGVALDIDEPEDLARAFSMAAPLSEMAAFCDRYQLFKETENEEVNTWCIDSGCFRDDYGSGVGSAKVSA